jgi:cell pole-organizing protein PopZ
MSEQDNQQEPTMEEVLASIRRIISEDGEESDAGVEVTEEVEDQPVAEAEPAVENNADEK